MSRVRDLWTNKDKTRSSRHGKGLRWQAIWTNGRGSEVKKSHRTKDAAWSWISEQDEKHRQGFKRHSGRVLVRELRDEWFDSQVQWSPKNLHENHQTWDNYIIPKFGDTLLEDLGRADLRAWVAGMRQKLSARTIDTYFGRFAAFLAWCVDEKLIPSTPAHGVELPKGKKRPNLYLTVDEYHHLRAHIHEHYRDATDLAVTTGMRPGELWELRAGDIDVQRRRIHITRSSGEVNGKLVTGDTKTEEARSIPMTATMAGMLQERIKGKRRTDLMFTTVRGQQVRQTNFSEQYWTKALKQTDLPQELRFYDLRHTAASWAIRSGASVKAVQRMLGHATAVITLEVYAHLFDDELDSVADKIGEMFNRHKTATKGLDAA